jgi:N-acetylglutamate synthase
MTSPTSLAQRVEEACLNGWPALQSIMLDGWQLRFSRGHTKRANSISLLRASSLSLKDKVGLCEKLYAMHRLPTIFRLSSLDAETIDPALDAAGFGPRFDEACVLYRDLAANPAPEGPDTVILQTSAGDAWFDALARIQNLSLPAQANNRALLDAVAVPAAFSASLAPDGQIAAVAFGAVHDGIVCLNSVATDPIFQRKGHARLVVGAILAWAQRQEQAKGACLPVVADNAAALALYHALGFSTEIFRYSYRLKQS